MKAENNKILKEKKNWILLLFKKLAKLIFNRIFYVAVAMLVQLGWILMMVLRLAAYSRYIDIGLRLIGIVLVLWILNKEINPSYKLAWTMLILILPILGVVLYFVFGRSRIAAIMQQHFEQRIEESREYLRDRPQTRQKLEALDPSAGYKYDTGKRMQKTSLYQSYNNPILSSGNSLPSASFPSAYFHSASASLKVFNCPKNSFAASRPTTPLSVKQIFAIRFATCS